MFFPDIYIISLMYNWDFFASLMFSPMRSLSTQTRPLCMPYFPSRTGGASHCSVTPCL